MAYGARLESELGESPQGFKSPILRAPRSPGGLPPGLRASCPRAVRRTLTVDPPRGVTPLNPPGPEGSKGRRALSGVRGVPHVRHRG